MLYLRQLTAAFLLFILTGILAAPAMAAAAHCVVGSEKEGCCCAQDEATEHANLGEPDCECPSCACALEERQTPAPWAPIPAAEQPTFDTIAVAAPTIALDLPLFSDHGSSVAAPRGPPPGPSSPLYLLYDTLLI